MNSIRRANVQVNKTEEGDENDKGVKSIFKEIIAEHF
jgi:hypothetical protein